jgi:hypothetical protein
MKLRAVPGKVIVKFQPYKRDGVIEIPDSIQLPSVEAEVVSDGDNELEPGAKVVVSRLEGENFSYNGEEFCTVDSDSILMQRL